MITDQEIAIEKAYRYEERLAILCPFDKRTVEPTKEQKAIAQREADEWERMVREQLK